MIRGRIGITGDHVVLLMLLASSLGLNLYLGARLRVGSPSQPGKISLDIFKKGDLVAAVDVTGLGGTLQTIALQQARPTILYIFSPACRWCKANAKAVESLFAQTRLACDFLALSVDEKGTREFVADHAMTFPTFVLTKKELSTFVTKLPGVPATLLVTKGAVEDVWSGAYTGETKKAIESRLQVSLPTTEKPPE